MPIIGWIRDLFGIQKDMYETKKTRLEIEKIEDEKREKLITPATFEDVKRYDPALRRVMKAASEVGRVRDDRSPGFPLRAEKLGQRRKRIILLFCAAALILLVILLIVRKYLW